MKVVAIKSPVAASFTIPTFRSPFSENLSLDCNKDCLLKQNPKTYKLAAKCLEYQQLDPIHEFGSANSWVIEWVLYETVAENFAKADGYVIVAIFFLLYKYEVRKNELVKGISHADLRDCLLL